jgi:mono/diheme cytochrome c family protein
MSRSLDLARIAVVAASLSLAAAARGQPARPALSAGNVSLTPFERRKAEALLRDQLPCLGCHALGGEGGRLAPELADVGRRRGAAYVSTMVDDPQRVAPGTMMPRTPMPAATRALIVRYLVERSGAPAGGEPPARAGAAPAADTSGERLYARFCAGCHGARGAGDGPNARALPVRPADHTSRAEMGRRTDDRLYDAIAAGGAPLGRSARMPAFGATLTPAQMWALVRHVRALCDCEPPRWSADGERRAAGRGAR